jgi:hypothetical protein
MLAQIYHDFIEMLALIYHNVTEMLALIYHDFIDMLALIYHDFPGILARIYHDFTDMLALIYHDLRVPVLLQAHLSMENTNSLIIHITNYTPYNLVLMTVLAMPYNHLYLPFYILS